MREMKEREAIWLAIVPNWMSTSANCRPTSCLVGCWPSLPDESDRLSLFETVFARLDGREHCVHIAMHNVIQCTSFAQLFGGLSLRLKRSRIALLVVSTKTPVCQRCCQIGFQAEQDAG